MTRNPHGTCADCCWHSRDETKDADADRGVYWRCWRLSGAPEVRLTTMTDRVPPACESHLRTGE